MVLALYIAIQIVSTGVLGSALSDFAEAPLAQVAFEIFGGVGITIILLGTFLSMFGTIAGDFLSSPRIFFAGSKQGLLPKVLARIHPNYKTPHIAIIAFAMITFIFSVSGAFRQLAILSSAALLTVYLLVCIATIKMRLAEKEKTEGFRLPFGISIPVVGIVIVVWFLSNLPRKDWFALFTFVAICTLYYFSALWKKKGKRI
jgi:amino acid transporter